ncbi:MAG: hypothetical protein MI974_09225 [Chitinophagales bacterium]|nr:hypothetical protein [Chitinophagales bacterium]
MAIVIIRHLIVKNRQTLILTGNWFKLIHADLREMHCVRWSSVIFRPVLSKYETQNELCQQSQAIPLGFTRKV